MTREDFLRIANLPYPAAMVSFAGFTGAELLEQTARHFGVPDAGKGWYMHPEDHQAALRILLAREPTWLEVWTSLYGGSGNIDAAWRLQALAADGAPVGWESFRDPFTRSLFALRFQHPFPLAAAIAEGKRKDPQPQETARLVGQWDEIRHVAGTPPGTGTTPPGPGTGTTPPGTGTTTPPGTGTTPPAARAEPDQRARELQALLQQNPLELLELVVERGLELRRLKGTQELLQAAFRQAVLLYREIKR
jgi:hypothetical protein